MNEQKYYYAVFETNESNSIEISFPDIENAVTFINISEKESTIFIEIDDTGIGRQQAISLDSGIGTSTYINLFETLNKTNTQKASFNIIDKQQGTTVQIIIPNNYIYS